MLTEFNRTLTEQETSLLNNTREEMLRKQPNGNYVDKSLAALWQNRVKRASEAYKELQALSTDYDETIVSENEHEASMYLEADAYQPEQLPTWPVFRDNFILDWMSNRIVVTEEEADKMFESDAESALPHEGQEQSGGESLNTSEPAVSSTSPAGEAPTATAEETPVVVTKRRGRPPGTKAKAKKVVKVTHKVKTARKVKKASAPKVARKGTSNSAKAQRIVEMYKGKGWARKDIIEKLQTQLEMGKAYASTLYQKYA